MNPRRVSLFFVVVCIPAIAAAIFGFVTYKHRQDQRQVLAGFVRDVTTGRKVNPKYLVDAYGPKEASRLIAENVKDHPTISFDGKDRWVQVLPVPLPAGQGLGDGYSLYSVLNGGPLREWTLERGTVVDDAELTPDGVQFSISGDIRYTYTTHKIPRSKPEIFNLPWPKNGTLPSSQTWVGGIMFNRHVRNPAQDTKP